MIDPIRLSVRHLAASVLLFFGTWLQAESAPLQVAGMFSDHMVLQRDASVPVWGWAEPGTIVSVEFAGATATARTGDDGRWQAELPRLSTSAAPRNLVVRAGDQAPVTFEDVLVGEVWFCSGQSNANMNLYKSYHAETEVALSADPGLRWFTVRNEPTRAGPDADAQGQWVTASPRTAWEFSAYGYYFARSLRNRLGIPIGVVQGAFGGTPCEAWISREALAADPVGQPLFDFWQAHENFFDPATKLSVMENLAKLGYPAYYYNARVAPVMPYAIRGAIWYQGESNRFRPAQYRELFPLMVRDWRARWGRGDFPFYYVQIANIKGEDNRDSEWPMLQFVQTQCLDLIPNSGMAVINDSVHNNLHPRDKRQVGQRLALIALARTYQQEVPAGGPLYDHIDVETGRIRVHFTQVDGGLAIRGDPSNFSPTVHAKHGFVLQGFEVRSADGPFVEAQAEIDGDTVLVSSPDCPTPVAVRYGWTSNAISANLSNRSGLPASLFRSDDDYPSIYYNTDPMARK